VLYVRFMRNLLVATALLAPTACTGALDNSGPDVPPVHVQVVVRDGEVPATGVKVFFQTESDTLVEETLTDAEGRAVGELPDGGNVSIVRTYPAPMPTPEDPDPEGRPTDVYTYIGVRAGDILEIGGITELGAVSAINVVVPTTAVGNVTVETPCGSGDGQAPNVAISVKSCPSSMTYYVMDSEGSSFVKLAPFSPSVDLSMELFHTSLSSSVGATNVPLDTQVTVEKRLEMNNFRLYSSGRQDVTTTTQNIDVPQLSGVDMITLATMSSQGRSQVVVSHGAFLSGPTIVDASAGMIPYISQPAEFTPEAITWLEEGAGVADTVYVVLNVTREIPEGGTPGVHNEYVRTIIAPHTGTALRVPVLPGTGILFNPGENDNVGIAHGIVATTGGYDSLRARAFKVENIIDATPLGSTTTLSYAGGQLPGLD
jgi:hypothetical protein